MRDRKEAIKFIKARPYLIWWVKALEKVNDEAIVEATLNYGDWDDVQELFRILGIKRVAAIFKKQAAQRRCNYSRSSKNYFTLYFKAHA
jgi:hypothetical protein